MGKGTAKNLGAALSAIEQASSHGLRLEALERGLQQAKARMNSLKLAAALGFGAGVAFACLWLYERGRHRNDRRERP